MKTTPKKLYHGSTRKIQGALRPILVTKHEGEDYLHNRPAVFATARIDLAALFMSPTEALASIGFEQDISYICLWGTVEEFGAKDKTGYMYVLPSEPFEKIGKGYEWQSFTAVEPIEVLGFSTSLEGMIECGVQVYFINDNETFDRIVADKENRSTILKNLISENSKRNKNVKAFT